MLFSPGLRTDPAGGPNHQSFNEDDDEESLNGDQIDNGPSTPVVSGHHQLEEEARKLEDEAQQEPDDDGDEFNPYHFIAHLPAHASVCILDKIHLPPLPRGASQKQELTTLALDLDETLVHCTVEPIPKPDLVFPVK